MPTSRHAVIAGSVFGWLASSAAIISGVIVTPLLLQSLGPRDYGFWILLQAFVGYAVLSDFGAAHAFSHLFARSRANEDQTLLGAYVRAATRWYGLLAFAALLVGGTLASGLRLGKPGNAAVIVLLGTATAITLLSIPATSVLASARRIAAVHQLRTAGSLVYLLGVIATVRLSLGLPGVAAAFLFSQGVAALGATWRARNALRRAQRARGLSPAEAKRVLELGAQYFFNALGWQLTVGTHSMIIAATVGLVAVAQFAPLVRMTELLGQTVLVCLATVQPLLAEAVGRGATEVAARLHLHMARAGAIVAALVFVGMLTFGEPALLAWVGPSGYPGFPVLVAISSLLALRITTYASGTLLGGIGQMRAMSLVTLAEGVANLALALWLVQGKGLFGIALASLVSHAAIGGWALPVTACRKTATAPRRYLKAVAVRPVLVLLLVAIPNGAVTAIAGHPSGLVDWAARLLLFVGLSIIAVGTVGLGRETRRQLVVFLGDQTGRRPYP
jgi:O-antigen/teichoic acid export membrane protein